MTKSSDGAARPPLNTDDSQQALVADIIKAHKAWGDAYVALDKGPGLGDPMLKNLDALKRAYDEYRAAALALADFIVSKEDVSGT